MLVDPLFPALDHDMGIILSVIGGGNPGATRLRKGMYETTHFSLDHMLGKPWDHPYVDEWRRRDAGESFNSIYENPLIAVPHYGVCDSVEQFCEKYEATLEAHPKEFVVRFTRIDKADQPAEGGWRWHKWGEYIGTKNPECEYIRDEGPEIETVYCFNLLVKFDDPK